MTKFLVLFILSFNLHAANLTKEFLGKVIEQDKNSRMLKVKFKDTNIKFFKKEDEVFLYNEFNKDYQCRGIVRAGNYAYLFVEIKEYANCSKRINLSADSYVMVSSKDLEVNLDMAEEVVDILLKKRMILKGKVNRLKNEIETKDEREKLLNEQYEIKMSSLKIEWDEAIKALRDGEYQARKEINDANLDLIEIDKKLKLYNIDDPQHKRHEWSLDVR
ncbi:MAG: hypothetical protein H6621_05015 [Halobacteriovoraceae bacterium]|nr:hypothetical protein [Halobacteriovoraceae bacterium]